MEFILSNASLPDRPGRWCVRISAGQILEIQEGDQMAGERQWDLEGKLLSPGFVDAHVHLDKCLIADRVAPVDTSGLPRLAAMIESTRALKGAFTVEDVQERGIQALDWSIRAGVTVLRSQVEADPFVDLRAVAGLQRAVAHRSEQITVQLAAFPQEGWFKTEGTREAGSAPYIEQALQQGLKVIGGNVNRGIWPSDPQAQVDELFQLAHTYDCDLDLHLDNWDGPEAFTLPYVIQKTIEQGWQGRVVVSHIPSLCHVPEDLAQGAIDGLRQAQITVAILPKRIRLTRVRELMEAGVNVLCATDNLRDKFIPYGQADPLVDLLLLAQLLGMTVDRQGLGQLWQMATMNAALGIRLPDYGIAVGNPADLMVVDAPGVAEAIWTQAERLLVLKRGQPVAGRMGSLLQLSSEPTPV